MLRTSADPVPAWVSQVAIRPVKQTDLPTLEWDGEYAHFRRLYADIYQSTRDGRALMWVAELSRNEIIGQIFVQLKSNRTELADGVQRAYIYGFRIKPDYRRNGLGTRMLWVVENELAHRKFNIVNLNVSRDNIEARRLYEQNGYELVGLDPGIWSYLDPEGVKREVHEPAWRMEKLLLMNDR